MSFIRRGFLLPGGAAKPQECLLPFKVLPHRMATKSPAQGWHNYALKSIIINRQNDTISSRFNVNAST